jgi:DNA-binding HxlR family transcriptional regulator
VERTRGYGEACAAAHALDLVGERWALLVVRELVFGPKRFSDLRAGLPHIGPNRLSERLRSLERSGIVMRRRLGPPVGSAVYALTEWGQRLQPVLVELGRWGRMSPSRDLEAHLSVDALMLALYGDFDPELAGDLSATWTLHFGTDAFTIRAADGHLDIHRGEDADADAAVSTDPATFAAVLVHRRTLDDALAAGDLTVTGDHDTVRALLACVPRPDLAGSPVQTNDDESQDGQPARR